MKTLGDARSKYKDQKEQKIETNVLNWRGRILSVFQQKPTNFSIFFTNSKSAKMCKHTVMAACVQKMTSLMILTVQLQPCAVHLEEV